MQPASEATKAGTVPQQKSKLRYTGQTKNTLRDGHGVYEYSNGFKYDGDWVSGRKHGHGKLLMGECGYYEGYFDNGEIEGHGVRVTQDGSRYEGSFHLGEKTGEGKFLGANGEQYSGSWFKNKYHGNGDLVYPNRDRYVGAFSNHKPDGYGVLIKSAGGRYEGNWKNGMRNGEGHETWADGSTYEGEWSSDVFHGNGTWKCQRTHLEYSTEFVSEKPTALFIADAASVRGTAVGTTIPPLTVEVVDSKGQIVSSESGREISASLAYKRSLQLSPRTMRKLSKLVVPKAEVKPQVEASSPIGDNKTPPANRRRSKSPSANKKLGKIPEQDPDPVPCPFAPEKPAVLQPQPQSVQDAVSSSVTQSKPPTPGKEQVPATENTNVVVPIVEATEQSLPPTTTPLENSQEKPEEKATQENIAHVPPPITPPRMEITMRAQNGRAVFSNLELMESIDIGEYILTFKDISQPLFPDWQKLAPFSFTIMIYPVGFELPPLPKKSELQASLNVAPSSPTTRNSKTLSSSLAPEPATIHKEGSLSKGKRRRSLDVNKPT